MDDQTNEFAGQGDYRSSENNVSMGLTMLFVGLALGALAALLLAPKTGKQMRRTLRRKYEDARDTVEELGDQASDWVDRGSEWAEKAKQRVAPFSKPFRRWRLSAGSSREINLSEQLTAVLCLSACVPPRLGQNSFRHSISCKYYGRL